MKRKKDEEEGEKKWRETINEWVKKKETKRALPPFLSSFFFFRFFSSFHPFFFKWKSVQRTKKVVSNTTCIRVERSKKMKGDESESDMSLSFFLSKSLSSHFHEG